MSAKPGSLQRLPYFECKADVDFSRYLRRDFYDFLVTLELSVMKLSTQTGPVRSVDAIAAL